MSELKDNSLDIELPVKKIRLTYRSNLGIILVLTFWTLFWTLFTFFVLGVSSIHPIKRLWNDWVISKNYEFIPDAYARYECYNYGGTPEYINCKVTFNAGEGYKEEKLNYFHEEYPYSWYVFLLPDNLELHGLSPMVRSVDSPSRTSFLFGIETVKIRFLSLLITKAFQFTFIAVWFYGLYIWWKIYYWRRFPNNVQLKAVKIASIYVAEGKGKVYHFFGLSPSIAASGIRYLPSSVTIVMPNPMRHALAATQLRNGLEPIFLDKEQTIGVAIEAQQAGSGYLLDYNLTYLVLSKKDKEKLITNIKAYQQWIAQHPEKLQQLSEAIDAKPKNR
ncbi:hypothetical protein [Bartonella sp. HY761]|uniref:hypothetical protein n=1 Tax=Bartonella sp. HY761 TaxID=2979330 RepID=UPI0021F9AE57|nr:hypothetical protein [Bartonella sp. HY761]UXN06506.1 hypothetical protein N6A79_00305 [Bartonella sp. HY761]